MFGEFYSSLQVAIVLHGFASRRYKNCRQKKDNNRYIPKNIFNLYFKFSLLTEFQLVIVRSIFILLNMPKMKKALAWFK